jgi:hypothetical protein
MPSKKIDFDVVQVITMALPDVEESTIHEAPSGKSGTSTGGRATRVI